MLLSFLLCITLDLVSPPSFEDCHRIKALWQRQGAHRKDIEHVMDNVCILASRFVLMNSFCSVLLWHRCLVFTVGTFLRFNRFSRTGQSPAELGNSPKNGRNGMPSARVKNKLIRLRITYLTKMFGTRCIIHSRSSAAECEPRAHLSTPSRTTYMQVSLLSLCLALVSYLTALSSSRWPFHYSTSV